MSNIRAQFQSVSLALGLAFVSFAIGAVIVTLAAGLLSAMGVQLSERPSLQIVLSTVLLQGVTFGAVAVAYKLIRGPNAPSIAVTLPTRREVVWVVGGSLLVLGLLVALSFILSLLSIETATNQVLTLASGNPAVLLLLIPLSYLLVGPGEELLFRGLIQGTLIEDFHRVRAIILASAIFASIHIFSLSGEGKVAYLAVIFLIAIVLGVSYERTNNLAVPALIHATYNAVQFAVAYVTLTNPTAAIFG